MTISAQISPFVRHFRPVLWVLVAASCDGGPLIDRVGVNVVDKSIFEGSWYMSRTVIDVAYEGAATGTFIGDAASDFSESSFTALPRIRWVIEEDFLYAYRDYEFIQGVDGVPRVPGEHLGQPVAAYAIESHFDIRRAFNPVTGEEQNVLVENDEDRRWFDREFMRVDWSKNLLTGYYGQTKDLNQILGIWEREPADLFVQGSTAFPEAWKPQFHRMGCRSSSDARSTCTEIDRAFADEYDEGKVYAMSFVGQEILSPGMVPDPVTGDMVNWCVSIYGDAPACTALSVFTRTAFLRVSERRQYVPENWNDRRFDRHGFFRLEQPTVDRRTGADDSGFGETDFLNYNVNRQNLWREWTDAAGNPIPFRDRRVRKMVWTTTPELPAHLVKPSLEVIGSWNETLMSTVRALRGEPAASYPRVPCQTTDPDGYCFCATTPGGEPVNPTCVGHHDLFATPAAAAAAGAQNPYRCHVDVPPGAEPAMDDEALQRALNDGNYLGWFGAEFVGDECVLVLEMNPCNRQALASQGLTWSGPSTVEAAETAGLTCAQRGDIRYRFLSYVDQPGLPFLGVATLRGDPVTGEIITGDVNVAGPALDGYRVLALQQMDVISGSLSQQALYTGEDIRRYLQSINQVSLPAPPRINFHPTLDGAAGEPAGAVARRTMDGALTRARALSGPEGRSRIFSDRISALAGSATERRLTGSQEFFAIGGVSALPENADGASLSEVMLDQASPFRTSAQERLSELDALERSVSGANVLLATGFVDDSVTAFVENHRDYSRARLELELNRLLYFETQLHELGHGLGLRHQFAGSADRDQYHDDYYRIRERFPFPDPGDFDSDGDPGLNADEQVAYESAYAEARSNRELTGMDRWMSSSVMDYPATWYERTVHDTGRYDRAAVHFGYGDLVELYDNVAGIAVDDVTPENTPRVWARYYEGGELCSVNSDCPYNASGPLAGLLLDGNRDADLTQRCALHPTDPALGRICTNFDDDAQSLPATGRFLPVQYRFCTDDRATGGGRAPGTIGICNRFDEGDSYREIVRNVQESYDRMYLWTNFRRYRSTFDLSPYVFNNLIGGRLVLLQNIYQNLLFRYENDAAFRDQEGAFGFDDQFFATADILNFYARVLGTPDVGAYDYDQAVDRYVRLSADPDDFRGELSLPIGLARYGSTVYQAGLSGIYRIERIGTFYDKWFVLDLMSRRGEQPNYTLDVPFYTNFYDLFPLEVGQIFGGMIRDQPEAFMPRVRCGSGIFPECDDPTLVYPDFYRGDCRAGSDSCRGTVETLYDGDPVVDGGGSLFLQIYAALYALAEFPVFFDTTFARQLFICREGAGDCPVPREGAVEDDIGAPGDFARHLSERFGQTYLAFRVESQDASDPTGENSSLGFLMVREARDLAFVLSMLDKYGGGSGGTPLDPNNLTLAERTRLDLLGYVLPADAPALTLETNRVRRRLVDLEGFFNQLIQLERDLGVASYLRFTG